MDSIDRKILKAINKASPKSFISPVKVNEILKMDETEFGIRLMLLKKSGHCRHFNQRLSFEFCRFPMPSSKVFLTELGRKVLKEKG